MFTNFYEAWHFLTGHPMFFEAHNLSMFKMSLDIDVVKVNPATDAVDDNEAKNTETRVWLEAGRWMKPGELDELTREHQPLGMASHDIDLDCGAPTFEEAIVKLANLVHQKYGDYARKV